MALGVHSVPRPGPALDGPGATLAAARDGRVEFLTPRSNAVPTDSCGGARRHRRCPDRAVGLRRDDHRHQPRSDAERPGRVPGSPHHRQERDRRLQFRRRDRGRPAWRRTLRRITCAAMGRRGPTTPPRDHRDHGDRRGRAAHRAEPHRGRSLVDRALRSHDAGRPGCVSWPAGQADTRRPSQARPHHRQRTAGDSYLSGAVRRLPDSLPRAGIRRLAECRGRRAQLIHRPAHARPPRRPRDTARRRARRRGLRRPARQVALPTDSEHDSRRASTSV